MGCAMQQIAELVTALAALGAVGVSIWNSKRIKEVHLLINSRMDELLRVSGIASRAEGVQQGREDAMKENR